MDDGGLLAVFPGWGLIRIDKQSRLQWALEGGYHHDVHVAPDGTIYTLHFELHEIPRLGGTVLEDAIVVVSPKGEVIRRLSLVKAFENSPYAPFLKKRTRFSPDIFHTNSVQFLDDKMAEIFPAVRPGNVLISIRNLNLIAVVDLEAETIRWALAGLFRHQHESILLETGNIILFDNEGYTTKKSSVIEFEPLTQRIVWRYPSSRPDEFFTNCCGTNQRLANGNTLISETLAGRVIEVNSDNRIGSKSAWSRSIMDEVQLSSAIRC